MINWRERLFAFMSRNDLPVTLYFGIPPGRVIEIGIRIQI
jgi:KUP system potassium uptake protein